MIDATDSVHWQSPLFETAEWTVEHRHGSLEAKYIHELNPGVFGLKGGVWEVYEAMQATLNRAWLLTMFPETCG